MKLPASRRKRVVTVLAIGMAASLGLLAALSEFHEEITDPWLRGADDAITNYLHQRSSPFLTGLMFALTIMGTWEVMFAAVMMAFAWLFRRGNWREGLMLAIGVAGASLLTTLLKLLFQRPRPSPAWALAHETSFSFPSGHAVAACTFYGMLALLLLRNVRSWLGRVLISVTAVLLIVGTGASRVYLGVHFPSDVAAGFFVGLVWIATVVLAAAQLRSSPD